MPSLTTESCWEGTAEYPLKKFKWFSLSEKISNHECGRVGTFNTSTKMTLSLFIALGYGWEESRKAYQFLDNALGMFSSITEDCCT